MQRILLFIGCLLGFYYCSPPFSLPECEEPENAYSSVMSFYLVSDNDKTLIGEYGTTYEPDDVQFINEEGIQPSTFHINGGLVSFNFVEQDDMLNTTIDREFYLVLPPTNEDSREDTDTININFQLNEETKCNTIWFEFIEVSYNDSLYYTGIAPHSLRFLKQ